LNQEDKGGGTTPRAFARRVRNALEEAMAEDPAKGARDAFQGQLDMYAGDELQETDSKPWWKKLFGLK